MNDKPDRGSKEKRIRIPLQVDSIYTKCHVEGTENVTEKKWNDREQME